MRDDPTSLPLRLKGVRYTVGGSTLIGALDLTLQGHAPTVILGPNGAGKSLTLRLCHGLIHPTGGTVEWLGPGAGGHRRRDAMVFQRPVMLRRSAVGNLIHALALAGVGYRQRRAAARTALGRFGLEAIAERPARVLSGGEQQRLALARAWSLKPEVLFLDEPTANLDPTATRAVETMIGEFVRDGIKIVMTTHDLGQARRLAGEIVFLNRGALIEQTPAPIFFERPRTQEAAAFLRGDLLC
ncbi:ABC transporter ATP-binding protein [Skermanella stibiiresistens SB22]|uniref:ABC transporter ATP-binding protein n=1 Tax=Skermanella stibiiresistens SB22 TaxID=1385369 RepID=W9HBL7_9PROT|nr:ATP-binding cassette domain-containing protein [Skermanella stibiiresistens]EWY42102.1 ABC transporter ATP-binding protein [Skermanella stibiiresistens SB22]